MPQHVNEIHARPKTYNEKLTSSISTLKATMPPNALTGSAFTASLYASRISSREATPQGFVCFTTTQVGFLNSDTQFQAASASK